MNLIKKIDEITTKLFWLILYVCIGSLLVLLTSQILSRFFSIQVLAPQDEIITLLFAWLVFLGIAVIARENGHLRVEFIDLFIKKNWRNKAIYGMYITLIQGVFLVSLYKSGFKLFVISGERQSPMLHLPQRIWYSSILISVILMLIYCIAEFLKHLISFINKGTET